MSDAEAAMLTREARGNLFCALAADEDRTAGGGGRMEIEKHASHFPRPGRPRRKEGAR